MKLYRPVGQKELELIKQSSWRNFPPRLPEQPIFYPVCNYEYAKQIADRWNQGESNIVSFEIEDSFINNYQQQCVGSKIHQEYWIPAEELESFNNHIIGKIQLI